jgi:hypothetical protein
LERKKEDKHGSKGKDEEEYTIGSVERMEIKGTCCANDSARTLGLLLLSSLMFAKEMVSVCFPFRYAAANALQRIALVLAIKCFAISSVPNHEACEYPGVSKALEHGQPASFYTNSV